ncbi:hypothetical protein V1511DRAFT_509919 [Dipodascopsis uninucleata]
MSIKEEESMETTICEETSNLYSENSTSWTDQSLRTLSNSLDEGILDDQYSASKQIDIRSMGETLDISPIDRNECRSPTSTSSSVSSSTILIPISTSVTTPARGISADNTPQFSPSQPFRHIESSPVRRFSSSSNLEVVFRSGVNAAFEFARERAEKFGGDNSRFSKYEMVLLDLGAKVAHFTSDCSVFFTQRPVIATVIATQIITISVPLLVSFGILLAISFLVMLIALCTILLNVGLISMVFIFTLPIILFIGTMASIWNAFLIVVFQQLMKIGVIHDTVGFLAKRTDSIYRWSLYRLTSPEHSEVLHYTMATKSGDDQ